MRREPLVFRDYYSACGTRKTCHDVKSLSSTIRREAVLTIASAFAGSGIINEGDILIPAPQHTGRATYMKDIAELVACSTGARVCDILIRDNEPTLYGIINRKAALHMYLQQEPPEHKGSLYFLDNVVSTGTTYRRAKSLIGDSLKLMTYAVDYGRYYKEGK